MLSTPHGAKGQGIGHGLAEVIWEDGALGEMELLVIYPQKWLLCQNLLMCNWIVIKVNFKLNYYNYIPRITYNSTGVWNNKYFFSTNFSRDMPWVSSNSVFQAAFLQLKEGKRGLKEDQLRGKHSQKV